MVLPHEHVFVDLRTRDQPGYGEADPAAVVAMRGGHGTAVRPAGVFDCFRASANHPGPWRGRSTRSSSRTSRPRGPERGHLMAAHTRTGRRRESRCRRRSRIGTGSLERRTPADQAPWMTQWRCDCSCHRHRPKRALPRRLGCDYLGRVLDVEGPWINDVLAWITRNAETPSGGGRAERPTTCDSV